MATTREPIRATAAYSGFIADQIRTSQFFLYVINLSVQADNAYKALKDIIQETSGDERVRQELTGMEDKAGAADVLMGYQRLMTELSLCRAVDSYLIYLSDLLALIFATRPDTLKSSETVRLDMVLEYKNMDDLVAALAEARVNSLSYKGMRNLSKYLSERLGFRLFSDSEAENCAIEIVELRNLIVHNRGVVNRIVASRLPSLSAGIGKPVPLDPAKVFSDLIFLIHSARDIDGRAADKFDLPLSS